MPTGRLSAIDFSVVPDPPPAHLLRIVFTSDLDVETASGSSGSGLYVQGDFCPHREWRLYIAGPYYGDLPRLRESPPGRRLRDGTIVVPSVPNRHPPRDPRTGRFVYTAYLAPYQAAARRGSLEVLAYDLHGSNKDLCLRLEHPGYYLTKSRSGTFVVPAKAIAAALASDSAP